MNSNKHYHFYFLSLLTLWLGVYFNTLTDMVSVWNGSETYTYCFLILPIVLYLVHEKKSQLLALPFQSNGYFLAALLLGQICFLFADLAGVGVLTHLSAYGSLVCIVAAVYGWQVFKFLLFPLFFLIFSVPMGEELVPALQEVTADICVFLVQVIGIPVYREGLYIYIPNGTFEVAEACSGIRFLISMIAIGALYSYLFYQSMTRRIIFTLISIVLPIIANGFRAFGIIYVGHATNMEHAVGADHLVYGWVFFSIVLVLLMLIGKFWREDLTSVNSPKAPVAGDNQHTNLLFVLLPIACLLFQPAYSHFIVGQHAAPISQSGMLNYLEKQAITGEASWGPSFSKADNQWLLQEKANTIDVEAYVAHYHKDDSEQELINWGNRLFDIDRFSLVSSQPLSLVVNDRKVHATILNLVTISGVKKQLVYWYSINDTESSAKLAIKKAQLIDKLTGGTGGGYITILSIGNGDLDVDALEHVITHLAWL